MGIVERGYRESGGGKLVIGKVATLATLRPTYKMVFFTAQYLLHPIKQIVMILTPQSIKVLSMSIVKLKRRPDAKRSAIYFPNETYLRVKAAAEANDLSVNSVLLQLVEIGLEAIEADESSE